MSLRLSGQNQLSYLGVTPLQPPDLVYMTRNPISGNVANADYRQFNVGTLWVNWVAQSVWILIQKPNNTPLWISLGISPSGLLQTLTTDDMHVVTPLNMNINLFGDNNITTKGAIAHEAQITLNPDISVFGVTTINLTVAGTTDLIGPIETSLAQGVVQSPGGGGQLFSTEGTDGQILIGSSAGAPAWANITSMDGSVTITNGHNTIDLSTTGSGGGSLSTLTGNSGVASPSSHNINVVTAHASVKFIGSGDTLTEDFLDSVHANLTLGSSLPSLAGGQFNTGYGALNLVALTSGNDNTAIGSSAGTLLTSGDANTLLGYFAGANLVVGDGNVLVGSSAGINYTNAESDNILISNEGVVGENDTIRIGTFGTQTSVYLQGITGSVSNEALVTVDTMTGQLGISSSSGPLNQLTGNEGPAATPSGGNINIKTANTTVMFDGAAVAHQLTEDFGLSNLLLGSPGSIISGASNNAGFGLNALNLLTAGTDNTAIGAFAEATLTNGNRNTAVGFNALTAMSTQNDNTALGANSLAASIGGNNTAVGSGALFNVTTGTHNIAIGYGTGVNLTSTESANIYIGNGGVTGESDTIRIGTQAVQSANYQQGIYGVTPSGTSQFVIVNSSGQLGSTSVAPGSSGTIITTYNTPGSYTYTLQATSKTITLYGWAGGGGGGGGISNNSGYMYYGGAGGGLGGILAVTVPSLFFGASSTVSVIIGAGGAGGLGQTASDSATGGSSGGPTSFGSWLTTGGPGGVIGSLLQTRVNPGSVICAFGVLSYYYPTSLSPFYNSGGGVNSGAAADVIYNMAGTSGGGGGYTYNGILSGAGGNGGSLIVGTTTVGASTFLAGGAGGSGEDGYNGLDQLIGVFASGYMAGGTGGGGGGGSGSGSAFNGGNGGFPSGGGGGGGSAGGTNAGNGGNGGNGALIVIETY